MDATSGMGALKVSGRWHPQGRFPCLYTSTTPETALQEMLAANRYNRLQDHRSLPSTLVDIRAELFHLLDLTNGKLRQRLRLSNIAIQNCDWRNTNRFDRAEAITQALGRAAFDLGYEGIIAPSTTSNPNGRNVVIFPGKLLRSESIKLLTPIPNT
ncbi:RES family NAD+ phosphorylase [Pelagicoccus sp. NFK12]|uniref:RES family NAD+ phosphorylase n=2 Tax=Pelagicoccus enzymogenes TaxID=2773457 RepID=A0A927IGK9_9BACT|nr:RES family NAD+ phosphorylase [Pelagicoccus enzymogenes]